MQNPITRIDYDLACDIVDAVSGTATIRRCVEDNAARRFPNDSYLAYLEMIDQLNEKGLPETPYADLSPLNRFERNVTEVMALLEADGTLYIEGYRTFLAEEKQIVYVLNNFYGMSWVFTGHVEEAIKRKKSRRKIFRD